MEVIDVRRKNIVKVTQKIKEGKRERVVSFIGEVIKSRGIGDNKMVTIRQSIDGVGVDRILPMMHPSLISIEIIQKKAKRKK